MSEDQRPPDDSEPTRLDAADPEADNSLRPTETARTADVPHLKPTPIPASIGQYRILSKLGEGGMGVVYEAQQQSPKRNVAVKVVRGGQFVDEHRVRMFQREADTLARLKHANIAAIYESGRTEDGQHFFAMELVRGETLEGYMKKRSKNVTREELRFRLALFRKIADAVQYAHQRGVIHRDLKPSNVIVTDETSREISKSTISGERLPEIKILDFGLARITEGDVAAATMTTEVGVIKGTLPYMSPEQARGDPEEIDVRTDVYSLGVILYELLTGSRPYDVLRRSLFEAVRVICEDPPTPLRQTWSGVRRPDHDIETILGKALEKTADRRYASAAALSEDIDRWLTSQPILARAPSTLYQLGKFAGRNKVLVSGAAAVFAALAIGAAVSTWQAVRAKRAEAQARQEAETSEQVSEFLVGLFKVSDPNEARGNTVTAREILDKGAERIRTELSDQPFVQARLSDTMGWVYQHLGLYNEAVALMEQAAVRRETILGSEDPLTLETKSNLCLFYWYNGRYDLADPVCNEATTGLLEVLGEEHPATLNAMTRLAPMYGAVRGMYAEAERLHRASYEGLRRLHGELHTDTLNSLHNIAICVENRERYEEAEEIYRQVLDSWRQLSKEDCLRALMAMSQLAGTVRKQGRYVEAESRFLEAIEAQRRVLGPEHDFTIKSMDGLAEVYSRQDRTAEAEELFRNVLQLRKRAMGEAAPSTLYAMGRLASYYLSHGEEDKARALTARRVDLFRQTAESEEADPKLKNDAAIALITCRPPDLRDPEAALRLALEANESTRYANPRYLETLARVYHQTGKTAKAIRVQNMAVAMIGDGPDSKKFVKRLAEFESALQDKSD